MSAVLESAPASNAELRSSLYEGAIFLLPASNASLEFATAAEALLTSALAGDPRTAHERMDGAAIFAAIGKLRRRVFVERAFHELLLGVIGALDFAAGEVAFDPARLRAVLDRGHENPLARAAYAAHRDTWYANPDAVITCWIPLADLGAEETFFFYPEAFARPVANDSEAFDYQSWAGDDWGRKIGWQRSESGNAALYPAAAPAAEAGEPLGFACRRGQQLLFAGAHLHRTRPLASSRIRYNLDFRLVHLGDAAAGRGAPNVDNRARGSSLADYVHPGRPWSLPG